MNHCALYVNDILAAVKMYHDVFGMNVTKTDGDPAHPRQVWMTEGLQLTETEKKLDAENGILNHISLDVEDMDGTLSKLYGYGAVSMAKGKNWILLPSGLCIELLKKEGA
jgi:predicted enzyme related to lactoylglutathione lyase